MHRGCRNNTTNHVSTQGHSSSQVVVLPEYESKNNLGNKDVFSVADVISFPDLPFVYTDSVISYG